MQRPNLKFNFISLDIFSTSSSPGSRKMTGVICEINYKKCKGSQVKADYNNGDNTALKG